MNAELSLIALVLNASLVVQAVLVLLIAASIISWTLILDRARVLGRARRLAERFEARFWSGDDLSVLYKELSQDKRGQQGLIAIFRAGFKDFVRLRKAEDADLLTILGGTERAMRAALSREIDRLEAHLPLLATIGSVSPYVGLFGTVWGIMQSFHALGRMEQATLAAVAPGIAEALVATAIGLFAAIPAVVAYNRYADQVERLYNRYETFVEEFMNLLQRQGRG
ncbi:protein TolQ [Caldichromatium japonicum]|uniref:Tol-Pal system protein TolQ n=1 Tax=Caldichromatium japonicum TaxID=2699430 RepID=A0A6G7VCC7_9GAMM|nr:protein TolQ [Caldichromatium japonicum]QIK37560.1 protein TolQ [Caldichromatium japonicum]